MSEPIDLLSTYLHLARASQQRRRPHVRDRLLIIAGAIAARMGLMTVAAHCRYQILEHNPQHLLQRWPSFEDALADEDFLHLLRQVQRRYPQEKAEQMLESLGIHIGRERQVYYSDLEYAAALLGTNPDALAEKFGH